MIERRRFSRNHFTLVGYNLYFQDNWLAIPQRTIRCVFLARASRGEWVPEYPAKDAVPLGDDQGLELLAEERSRRFATA